VCVCVCVCVCVQDNDSSHAQTARLNILLQQQLMHKLTFLFIFAFLS